MEPAEVCSRKFGIVRVGRILPVTGLTWRVDLDRAFD